MRLDLYTIDWVAIGSLATGLMAIATFITLNNNKKQFKELQKQNFENTLFNLLHEMKKILNTVTNRPMLSNPTNALYGVDALEDAYKGLKEKMTKHYPNGLYSSWEDIEPTMENATSAYMDIYNDISNLGSYFRSLYRIIKYVHESKLSDKEKYQYISFVRAQLTDIELLWLFYNCTVGLGIEKFKPLVETYTLLKNLPESRLIDPKTHIEWIDKSAFKYNTKRVLKCEIIQKITALIYSTKQNAVNNLIF